MLSIDQLAPERARPIRRVEYDRLVEDGFLADERAELLDGVIVAMSPQKTAHAYVVQRLTALLLRAAGPDVQVRCQLPLALSELSEPEPDLAVVEAGDYLDDHPRDAMLIVEVADATLVKDTGLKARLYAEAGVPEYWVVDVNASEVIVHQGPAGDRYTDVHRVGREARLFSAPFREVAFAVADFVPPSQE